jgi:hypothetical protein
VIGDVNKAFEWIPIFKYFCDHLIYDDLITFAEALLLCINKKLKHGY